MPVFIRTRQEPRMFVELDFTKELPLQLHAGTIKFDAHDGKGEQVQYGGRTPSEERIHLDQIEKDALRKALEKEGLDPNTTDYPWHHTESETAELLGKIYADQVQLWDPKKAKPNPALSKGFPGASDIHIASMPGADTQVYNNVTFACLEDGISIGIVFESTWEDLWFYVWKSRQVKALQEGKHLVVLTKKDGSVGFNQSIEITWMTAMGMKYSVMRAVGLLRQIRPLVQAYFDGNIEDVRRGLAPPVALEAMQQRTFDGQQAVHLAAQSDSTCPTLEWALETGADPNAKTFMGASALSAAAQAGCHRAVKILLQKKADPEIANKSGQSPLWTAAKQGSTECLDLLIQAKANVDKARNTGSTPVFIAAANNNADCLKLLICAQADMDKANDNGTTPVSMATQENSKDCLDLLLRAKANVDKAQNEGGTPVYIAAQVNNADCLKLLLDAKANVDKANNDGATPVYIAAEMNSADCLKLLLNAKADVDKATNNGVTPACVAANNNSESCIKLLLHAKADMKKTFNGMSPLDFAKQQGSTACIKLLEDAEAGIGGLKE